jgi:hypothetical protein
VLRRTLLALVLAGCSLAPAARTPTPPPASATTQRPVPTALPSSGLSALTRLADGTLVASVPDCVTTHDASGGITGCELIQAMVDRGVFVAVLRWSDGFLEARAIDLATGEMRSLVPKEDFGLVIEDVRDDLVLIRETDDLGGGDVQVRLLRVPWRDPTKVEVLDEIDVSGVGGSDWNAWPYARTNGRDVVWLHAGGLVASHEIELLSAAGQKRAIATTDGPAFFDIDDAGRVALATFNADRSTQTLQLYDGSTLRQLATRGGDAAGSVASFGELIGWTRGFVTAAPPGQVDLVPASGGAARSVRPEPGCLVAGFTAKDVVTVCPAGLRLIDAATGAIRDGPNSRIVHSSRRGLLWQIAADLAANPQVWRITLLS